MRIPSLRSEAVRPGPARRGQVRYVRLQVEELESRTVPSVLTPAQVRHAYGFDQVRFRVNGQSIVGDGSGQTIAIVNAYNNTRIFGDLDTFDRAFSIAGWQTLYQQYGPASRFLTQVNPQGAPNWDNSGGLWWLETALDVEWAHAIAPGARILLVQARSNSFADLLGAVDYARNQRGVVAVSMSWGSHEFASETYYDRYFSTPAGHLGGSNGRGGPNLGGGVTFVAAAGDQGAPGLWPAMSSRVLGIGGTRLSISAAGNYAGEVAWSGGGGGVSVYETKPAYQAGVNSGSRRDGPDVAYNGDPASGVYVYSSMPLQGRQGGWWQVGGTSAGTPQWAALVAIVDQGRALQGKGSLDGPSQTLPAIYRLPAGDFHDISQGSNGYSAHLGYDLATGRGTPIANQVIADLLRANAQGQLVAPATLLSGAPAGRPAAQTSFFVIAIGAPESTPVGSTDVSAAVAALERLQSQSIVSVSVSSRLLVKPSTLRPTALPREDQLGIVLRAIFADAGENLAEMVPMGTAVEAIPEADAAAPTDDAPWERELDAFFAEADGE